MDDVPSPDDFFSFFSSDDLPSNIDATLHHQKKTHSAKRRNTRDGNFIVIYRISFRTDLLNDFLLLQYPPHPPAECCSQQNRTRNLWWENEIRKRWNLNRIRIKKKGLHDCPIIRGMRNRSWYFLFELLGRIASYSLFRYSNIFIIIFWIDSSFCTKSVLITAEPAGLVSFVNLLELDSNNDQHVNR